MLNRKMQVFYDLPLLPSFHKAVITIGTFDGVHKGHQQIIQQLTQTSKDCQGESVIITFNPHPREVLNPGKGEIQLLNTLPEKIRLLEKQEVDNLVVVPFTKSFSEQSAKEYLQNFLYKNFHPYALILGYDHHFGHNREGNINLLQKLKSKFEFQVIEIPQQVINHSAISSTKIRNFLRKGEVKSAAELLGYHYFLSGRVIHGNKIGRQLGFPTANLVIDDHRKLIPSDGIYLVQIKIKGNFENNNIYTGLMSIGKKPTFGSNPLSLEVYIFDFNQEIYGQEIEVIFLNFIRNQ
ncbi:MAG: bifunctional riboflavin kinase/FAD synthetase, partial [Chitinophagaceae bacterium]